MIEEGDVFAPDWGFPVGAWVRKFAWTRVKTEDHGYIRWKRYYRRPIRMYTPAKIVYQNVEEIDA